jgi:NAD(P)-dependent dehydrogenase (short-subunit alcohol dehydrogenase family)
VPNKVVFITGCSSGIGRALAQEFHQRGHRVVATARRIETLESLKKQGLGTETLDVTDRQEVIRVARDVLAREGRIDILVNNAGYGQFGPAIDIPHEELVSQFHTNVFAPLNLIRVIAPAMRSQGGGMIVNIGSISGIVTTPFAGAYCASKAALHALTDALRMELAPFGIQVVSVQPGGIKSEFGMNSGRSAQRIMKSDSWYIDLKESILSRAQVSQVGATSCEDFARRLVGLLEGGTPPAIVRIGSRSFSLPFLKSALPSRLLDSIFRKRFGLSTIKE